eukprot:jgi/Picsp_1/302/NSC_00301-R1_---NA---
MGIKTVALFTVLLAVIPLLGFRFVRNGSIDGLLLGILSNRNDILEQYRVIIGGIFGIVLVNILITIFLIVAFFFEEVPAKSSDNEINEGKKER